MDLWDIEKCVKTAMTLAKKQTLAKYDLLLAVQIESHCQAGGEMNNAVRIPKPKMVEIICKCGCRRKKMVRAVDVKRGWGKFFDKSCKAMAQERKTHQCRDYHRGR